MLGTLILGIGEPKLFAFLSPCFEDVSPFIAENSYEELLKGNKILLIDYCKELVCIKTKVMLNYKPIILSFYFRVHKNIVCKGWRRELGSSQKYVQLY